MPLNSEVWAPRLLVSPMRTPFSFSLMTDQSIGLFTTAVLLHESALSRENSVSLVEGEMLRSSWTGLFNDSKSHYIGFIFRKTLKFYSSHIYPLFKGYMIKRPRHRYSVSCLLNMGMAYILLENDWFNCWYEWNNEKHSLQSNAILLWHSRKYGVKHDNSLLMSVVFLFLLLILRDTDVMSST